MGSNTLHFLNMPANVPEPAFSLMPVPIKGVRTLTSLDHRSYYEENFIQGRNILAQYRKLLDNAHLPEFLASYRLPAVDPLRMRYQKLIIECMSLVDMLRRIDNLIKEMRPERIEYYGKPCWRAVAIQSLCAIRGISFHLHRPHWIKIKSHLNIWKRYFLDIGNWVSNCWQKHNKADYLFFLVGANRFSLGLLNVLKILPGAVRVIDARYNRLKYNENWRALHLEGEYPIIRRRIDLLEAQLRECFFKELNNSDIIWQGIPIGVVVGSLATDSLSGIVAEIQAVYAILEANPDAIVVATPSAEPLLEVARVIDRPVVVQVVFLDDYQLFLSGRGQYIVSSNIHADYMTNIGVPRQDIAICGNPFYDQFQDFKLNEEGRQLRRKLGIPDGERVVLFAEDYPDPPYNSLEEWEDRIGEIYRGLSMVKDVKIIVKLHPAPYGLYNRENIHHGIAEANGISNSRLYILKDILIAPVISACDLMVITISGTGEEAILLDKPLISFRVSTIENFKYVNNGAALAAQNSADITNAVHGILRDNTVRQKLAEGRACYRERYFHAQDGKVMDRIIKVFEENRLSFLKKQKARL